MDVEEFRKRGEEVVDYIADYLDSVSQRRVLPNVSPGFLGTLLPTSAPEKGESFEKIMKDLETHIMPGIAHWQHPRFHAYFPASCSYPSILAEIMSDTIGCEGFNWGISPSGAELETIVVDWYGKMMGLPDKFLRYAEGSRGGGVVQNSSSECVLIAMLTARNNIFERLQEKNPGQNKEQFLTKLIAYCSKESHSCVEKAAMISMVTIRILDTDENHRLRGETLAGAIKEDKENGLVPFFAGITLGTTSCCACDPIDEIGPVCHENDVWLNIDAAYAGTALMCPEYKHFLNGIEHASSFNVNPAKWMLVTIECAVMFTVDRSKINGSVVVDKTVMGYGIDEKDWGHRSNRRFRALKLWFVMRCYGVEGLQAHVRNHVRLAELFASSVRNDKRFELLTCNFGLVCFRLKGSNRINKNLLRAINDCAKLHLIACVLTGKYVIRFCVSYDRASDDDMVYAWNVIDDFATNLLENEEF